MRQIRGLLVAALTGAIGVTPVGIAPAAEAPLAGAVTPLSLAVGGVPLSHPESVAFAPGGFVVTDAGSGAVVGLDLRTPAPRMIVSLRGVQAVAASAGELYVAQLARVFRIDPGGPLEPVAGTGLPGAGGDGGPAIEAGLGNVTGMAVAEDGTLLIADAADHVIRTVSREGTTGTLAGTGVFGFRGDGQNARAARLAEPSAVAVLPNGDVLIADTGNGRIRRVARDGTISTVAGGGLRAVGPGVTATDVELAAPTGVAALPDSGFAVLDHEQDRMVVVGADGRIIWSTAADGCSGAAAGEPASAVQLCAPTSVAASDDGDLAVTDTGHHRVILFTLGQHRTATADARPRGAVAIAEATTVSVVPTGLAVHVPAGRPGRAAVEARRGRVWRIVARGVLRRGDNVMRLRGRRWLLACRRGELRVRVVTNGTVATRPLRASRRRHP